MEYWYEKIFSMQRSNGKVIKELGDIVYRLIIASLSLVALHLTSIGLVALKFMEKNLFANNYAPFFVVAIMVYFLLLIFYTAVLDDRNRTIATLFPITLVYGFACVWSFGTLRILIPQSSTFAVVNMVLWITGYIIIFAIYFKKKKAKNGSKQPLESTSTINGDGNAPEHPVMGPPTTQQMHVSGSGGILGEALTTALHVNGSMVDLEMNASSRLM
jgi:hypothetical protein